MAIKTVLPWHDFRASSAILEGWGLHAVPIMAGSKGPEKVTGWTEPKPREAYFHLNYPGSGILTVGHPAVDIDILDLAVANLAHDLAQQRLGIAPVRVGKAPKRALLYLLAPGEEVPKIPGSLWRDRAGQTHHVEVLGKGQQLMMAGLHPETLEPYTLYDMVPAAEFPQVSAQQLRDYVREVDELIATVTDWERVSHGKLNGAATSVQGDDDLDRIPEGLQGHAVPEILARLNQLDPDMGHADWLRVVQALVSVGGEHEAILYEACREWSSRATREGAWRPQEFKGRWKSLAKRPGKGATLGSLFWNGLPVLRGKANGYRAPGLTPGSVNSPSGERRSWSDFAMTVAEAASRGNETWLIEGLLAQTHVLGLIGPPGSGKTLVAEHLAAQLSETCRVHYVQVDVGGTAVKRAYRRSLSEKQLAAFDQDPSSMVGAPRYCLYSTGAGGLETPEAILAMLLSLAAEPEDPSLPPRVLIIDTIKKFVDMIKKSDLKAFLQNMRALTQQHNVTVLLLGHTNKKPDPDGWYSYEGTGDLRADVDDLLLLLGNKEGDNVTASLYRLEDGWPGGKNRGDIAQRSWRAVLRDDLPGGRSIQELPNWVDVKQRIDLARKVAQTQEARQARDVVQLGEDANNVELVVEALRIGPDEVLSRSAIAKATGLTQKTLRRLLLVEASRPDGPWERVGLDGWVLRTGGV